MDIVHTLDAASADAFQTKAEHDEAVRAARAFLARVQTPFERLMDLVEGQPALGAALKVCRDIDLFSSWDRDGGMHKTYNELADIAGVPASALRRLLRHLAANFVVTEVGTETYAQTSFSQTLKDPNFSCWIQYLYDATGPVFLELPVYLQRHGYVAPSEPRDGVFQATFNCKGKTLFEWYAEHPAEAKNFNICMSSYTGLRTRWVDFYPTETLIHSATEGPLVVDVGGNLGDDLDSFRVKHPEHVSRLVLQDLPEVVAKATCASEIQRMDHDFFTEQPIKGARAYYMHSIIHDWSDEYAHKILRRTVDAMKPGYSRLLINDTIMSASRPDPIAVQIDLTMMVKVAAGERTAPMFTELLESVGLKVIKIWKAPNAVTSLIEAEVPL